MISRGGRSRHAGRPFPAGAADRGLEGSPPGDRGGPGVWERALGVLHDFKTVVAVAGLALVALRAVVGGRGPFASTLLAFPMYLGFPLLLAALFARGLHGTADPSARLTPEAAPKSRRMRLVWVGMIALSGLFFLPHAAYDWRSVDLPLLERLDNGRAAPFSWRAALKVPPPVAGDLEVPTFRPLTWIVWWGVEAVAGPSPVAFGLASLAFHMLTVAMVIALALFYTGGHASALIAGGLVAFSPLALRAAAGRDALGVTMAAFFILATVHAFRSWQISNSPRAPVVATVCAALACASHELGLLAIPLLAYLSFARDRLSYRSPEERVAGMMPAVALAGIYLGASALVAFVNREAILGLAREVLTANLQDAFVWRVPYELLARLPNVLALAPDPSGPAAPAQRLYWVAFGLLVFTLALRGASFRLTTGLGGILMAGGAVYAVAPPAYFLARVDAAWSAGEVAYLPLIGLALVIGGMVPAERGTGAARRIRLLGGAALAVVPAVTIGTAWHSPPQSAFHRACAKALAALVEDLGPSGHGLLVDERNRCAWSVAARPLVGGSPEPRPALTLYAHGAWKDALTGVPAEGPPDPGTLAGAGPAALLVVGYNGGPQIRRIDERLGAPAHSDEGRAKIVSQATAAQGLHPWVLDGMRSPLAGQPLRFRAGYRRQARMVLATDVDAHAIDRVVIEGRRPPKRPGHPRAELQPVATLRWRTGNADHDLVYRRLQEIMIELPESAESSRIVVDLSSRIAWRMAGQVREIELAFDRVSSEFEIRSIALVGPRASIDSNDGRHTGAAVGGGTDAETKAARNSSELGRKLKGLP